METIISCCGVICSECKSYPHDCKGCPDIKGKAYWLEYTGEEICGLYDCCVNQKKLFHCGECDLLPCEHYERDDPTKTPVENAEDRRKQMEQLRYQCLIDQKLDESEALANDPNTVWLTDEEFWADAFPEDEAELDTNTTQSPQ